MDRNALEGSLTRVQDWIKAGDQKISIALVFEAGIIALLAHPTYSLLLNYGKKINSLGLAILVISAVIISMGVLKAINSLIPRISPPKGSSSLIFFGDIAFMKFNMFSKKVGKYSSKEYEKDLVEQIHISSVIAKQKHLKLADSLKLFSSGILFYLLAISILMIAKNA